MKIVEKLSRIPKPTMPTDEELTKASMEWWSRLEKLSLTSYNDALREVTLEHSICNFPIQLINKMLNLEESKNKELDIRWCKGELLYLLLPSLIRMGCKPKFFFKLVSRSPKDWLGDPEVNSGKPAPLSTIEEVFNALMSSMRTFEDMVWLKYIPDKAKIIVMPYVDFNPQHEYRVFIRNKEVIGVSQYYYNSEFPDLIKPYRPTDKYTRIFSDQLMIQKFIPEHVIPNIQEDSFIADVVIMGGGKIIKLIETNPWGLSDPCLFEGYEELNRVAASRYGMGRMLFKHMGLIDQIYETCEDDLKKRIKCSKCFGHGHFLVGDKLEQCKICKGKGTVIGKTR